MFFINLVWLYFSGYGRHLSNGKEMLDSKKVAKAGMIPSSKYMCQLRNLCCVTNCYPMKTSTFTVFCIFLI